MTPPKSTYEKNILLYLNRHDNLATVQDIVQHFDEHEVVIRQLVAILQKSKLVTIEGDNVYASVVLEGR